MEEKTKVRTKRKKGERQQDLDFCINKFLEGKKYHEISVLLQQERGYNVDCRTIYSDIRHVLSEWKKERIELVNDQLEIDLRKLDKLEAIYWECWEESKRAKVKTIQKEKTIFDKKKNKKLENLTNRQSEKHTTDVIGDIQWLDGVHKCMAERAKLLSYSKKVIVPGEDTGTIPIVAEIVFKTVSRKNNDKFVEAEEVTDTSAEDIQKLIAS